MVCVIRDASCKVHKSVFKQHGRGPTCIPAARDNTHTYMAACLLQAETRHEKRYARWKEKFRRASGNFLKKRTSVNLPISSAERLNTAFDHDDLT